MSETFPPVDHDQFFKELLTEFFVEFLDLFYPRLAREIDRPSIEFIRQEVFAKLLDGQRFETDILAKVKYRGADLFFLIHVEHQSTAERRMPGRVFSYSAALFDKYWLPVYPIVLYSHDRPRTKQPDRIEMKFPDRFRQVFRYRVIQLNRLPWRKFPRKKNPVANVDG